MRTLEQIHETGVAWCTEEEFERVFNTIEGLKAINASHAKLNGELREQIQMHQRDNQKSLENDCGY